MKIASINFYVANKQPKQDLDKIKALGPISIGFQETIRHLPLIERELKRYYDVYNSKRSDSDASNEVSIALSKHAEYLGHSGREVSDLEPGEETKVFKSRWITIVRFRYQGVRYAHINYHGNAVTQSKRTGALLKAERVKEWIEASIAIEKRIKALQARGYQVIVTGDWNYRSMKVRGFELNYYSPQRIFKRNGLEWYEHGLDYIAWPKAMKRRSLNVISTGDTGSDHPWLMVDLV